MTELEAFDIVVSEEGYCEGLVKYRRAVYDKSEADKVIAEKDKEIRRLRRALYKACANWAHEAKFDYDDEFSLWDDMEQRCIIKAEAYKCGN